MSKMTVSIKIQKLQNGAKYKSEIIEIEKPLEGFSSRFEKAEEKNQ